MASSDNVVRAGLTPKFKDIDTLVNMLDYQPQHADQLKFVPTQCEKDPCSLLYNPPVDDFSVKKIQVCPFLLLRYNKVVCASK